MRFMSWSLNAPSSSVFNRYIQKVDGEWKIVDPDGIQTWGDTNRNFFHMYEMYHDKITSFGMHEFGVWIDGTIYDFRISNKNNDREWEDGYPVLNADETAIQSWVPTSLQYLMENYPDIEYALQFICFGQKVDRILHLNREAAQNTFIRQVKKIAELYRERWPNVVTIEIDFEKTYTLNDGDPIYYDREVKEEDRVIEGYADGNDWTVYANFLKRIKDEVCIPLGMKLRVNMYAMTGDFNPHYYGWHDYKTLAAVRDKNGNQAIDEFQLMTYDFTYAYSAPGPSTPLWWLKDVLEHVKDSLPTEKTWIGNAGYGRRWGLDAQQPGNAVTYHQLVMWQNGMYVHNHGEQDRGKWIWHDQPWLPFTGFNDANSGYQITYPHLYDKFLVEYAKPVEGRINKTSYAGQDLITSYFKSQQPIFTGIKSVANKLKHSGHVNALYSNNGIEISEKYLGKTYHFPGAYRANKARYQYDENTESCVPASDETGKNGLITFDFSLEQAGKYKLIALVHFNTFTNNQINCSLNGSGFTIGGNKLEDWWPFYVDQYAWLEAGTFNFSTSNTITIGPSTGYIWGFVVCEDFDQNFKGGTVEFDSYLAPYYKRDSNGKPVKTEIPKEMVLTGELLRRPPRPAIIFEDIFSHHLSNEEPDKFNIISLPYYMRIQDHWESGSNKVYYEKEKAYACTDDQGIRKIGFSNGDWILQNDGRVKSGANAGTSNQLVLYHRLSCNVEVRADIVVSGTYPKAGIRLCADEEGNAKKGYLALLDYRQNKVVLAYEDGQGGFEEIASAWMSDSLINLKGKTVSIYATIHNNKAYVRVGKQEYLKGISLSNVPSKSAHGVYVESGTVVLSLFNVSTTDRYEPLEKLEIEIHDQIHSYGELERYDKNNNNRIPYDDFGYLIYSGVDIGETEPKGTEWDEDYNNLPLARVQSWMGQKSIKVRMVDAGIWFTKFFVGDAQGFSVAYNSDFIGFVETTKLLYEYGCRGVAMWTMGQEDPLIFDYLPDI